MGHHKFSFVKHPRSYVRDLHPLLLVKIFPTTVATLQSELWIRSYTFPEVCEPYCPKAMWRPCGSSSHVSSPSSYIHGGKSIHHLIQWWGSFPIEHLSEGRIRRSTLRCLTPLFRSAHISSGVLNSRSSEMLPRSLGLRAFSTYL
jgi:hypothetical protein